MNHEVIVQEPESKQYTLSMLVRNHAGVLSHVAGLFTRRGYNIESISAGITENPAITRITIIVTGDKRILEQVVKQCQKLVDVIKVKSLKYNESVTRELALIAVKANQDTRSRIIEIADVFGARIVDMAEEAIMLEVTGNTRQINSIIRLLSPFGIEEIGRTGVVALQYRSQIAAIY
ncbi:acetolactate synthase small subunit [candidate division KSB3 bacterium]|uniref:Acetolactate synthase small subunit n=1 Tax=candidate division KSB3 bacterium TaxID=2044937 RepID=A0A9D5JV61_9BACT|nr:acetolactate synthase small subunit [candidate division KSB3 bacterium]MBD3324849.1 acetolactate synthase small subunit [candidate division KSB3 bacterium]